MKLLKLLAPLTVILTALTVDPTVYLAYHTPKNYLLIMIIPIMVFAFMCTALIKQGKGHIGVTWIEVLLLLRMSWMVLTNPKIVLHTNDLSFLILTSLFLLTFILRQSGDDFKAGYPDDQLIKIFLMGIFITGIIQSGIGYYQYYMFNEYSGQYLKTPMIGFIGSANGYGTFLAVSIIIGLYLLIQEKSRKKRWFIIILTSIILFALLLNKSRGALFGLIGSLTILLVIHRITSLNNDMKKIIMHASLAGVTFLLIGVTLFQVNKESSIGRIMMWQVSAPMVLDNPVMGVGQGNYELKYLDYQARYFRDHSNDNLAYKASNIKQAHNEFIQAFCETGVVGGLFFVLIWIIPVISFIRIILRKQGNMLLYTTLVGVLFIILIHSQVESTLHVLPIAVISYSILGFTPLRQYSFRMSKFALFLITFASVVYIMFSINKVFSEYPGYKDWFRGTIAVRERRFHSAILDYEKAILKMPYKGELQFHLGSAYIVSGSYSKGIYYVNKSKEFFNNRNIYLSLSFGYLKLKDYHEAEKNAKIALEMFPDHLMPYFLLGQIYYEDGRLEEAKSALKKCINRETKIQSDDVEQISEDARKLWNKLFE